MEIKLFDTTLRDGTQGEGLSLSVDDKLKIARLLDQFGMHFIEGGWPASNPKDSEFFRRAKDLKLRHAKLTAFGSTRKAGGRAEDDVNLRGLLEASTPAVAIFGKSWLLHVLRVLGTTRRGEPGHDPGQRGLPEAARARKWSTTPSTSSTATATSRSTPSRRRRGRRGGGRLGGAVRHERRQPALLGPRGRPGREGADPGTPLGIHTHNDGELAVANALGRGGGGLHPGPGHHQRLRRALRQRQPRLRDPRPAAQDGPPLRERRSPSRASPTSRAPFPRSRT